MILYVANCTKQVHDFLYRVPGEDGRMRKQEVPMGGQIRVYNDAATHVLKGIIEQHERYGLVPVDEIDRTRDFIGMCYSFDKPIEVEKIMRAVDHNTDVLVKVGQEIRKTAAVATNNQLLELNQGNSDLNHFEVEVVEETKKGDDTPGLNEGIEVLANGASSRHINNDGSGRRNRRGR